MNIGSVLLERIDNPRFTPAGGGRPDVEFSRAAGMKKEYSPDRTEIHDMVSRLNKTVEDLNERISFSYHEKTNRVILKVIDSDTNEVVREIPPRDLIRLLEHIQEYMGMFVDESR